MSSKTLFYMVLCLYIILIIIPLWNHVEHLLVYAPSRLSGMLRKVELEAPNRLDELWFSTTAGTSGLPVNASVKSMNLQVQTLTFFSRRNFLNSEPTLCCGTFVSVWGHGKDHDLWQPEQDLDLHAALILCPAAALKRSTHSPLTFVTTFFNVHPVRWQLTLMLHEGHAWEEKLTVFYISEFPGLLATTLEPFHDLGRKTLAWQNVSRHFLLTWPASLDSGY